MSQDPIKTIARRNFAATSEPIGGKVVQGDRIFVIQKHYPESSL